MKFLNIELVAVMDVFGESISEGKWRKPRRLHNWCLFLSYSSTHRDQHDDAHELYEEDQWSEEGPHWPQSNIKAA